jgi:GNAT superfamily N-acetyltransferase
MAKATPVIRPLAASDLVDADRVLRVAFGTYLGAPEPERFFGDAEYVRTRFGADPDGALGAFVGDRLVGSNFLTRWGSVGFFGPLSVSPEHWDDGIGQALLERTVAVFEAWGTRHVGLFTFAQSAKHVHLYQGFGFWPRYLTAVMSAPVHAVADVTHLRLAELNPPERAAAVRSVAALTDEVYEGLDLTREIDAVLGQRLGDVVVLADGATSSAVAICHLGAGTEAGGGCCYVKFAAVRAGGDRVDRLGRLLDAVASLASAHGATTITAGVNAERPTEWRALAARGFRVELQGVAMHRPDEPGYNAGDALILDDWR